MTLEEIKRQRMIEDLQQKIDPNESFGPQDKPSLVPASQFNDQDIEVDQGTEISREPASGKKVDLDKNYFNNKFKEELRNAILSNDTEKERLLLRGQPPTMVREVYDEMMNNAFRDIKTKDILSGLNFPYGKSIDGDTPARPEYIDYKPVIDEGNGSYMAGFYDPKLNTVNTPKDKFPSTLIHEYAHAQDNADTRGRFPSVPIDLDWERDLEGVRGANIATEQHHKSAPNFSRNALWNISVGLDPYTSGVETVPPFTKGNPKRKVPGGVMSPK